MVLCDFGGVLDGEEVQHPTRVTSLAAHAMLAEWCRIGTTADLGLRAEDLA